MTVNVRPPPIVLVLGSLADPNPLPLSRLTEAGYHIADHRPDADGVALARRLGPDVILVDVTEVNAQGLALCQGLQTDAGTRHIPLIAVTGEPVMGQFMVTLRVAPCDADSLHAEVIRVLNGQSAGGDLRSSVEEC